MAAKDRSRSPRPAAKSQSGRFYDSLLATAEKAARAAGELIRQAWWANPQGDVKATKSNTVDLVTETDQKCEEVVMQIIRKDFPDDRIIGEESSGSGKYDAPTDVPTWTVDPIDGTTNFVHRFPQSCVIIGYLEGGHTCVGLVYDPIADELFTATKGGGAFLRAPHYTGRIRASETTAINKAVISMEVGYGRDEAAIGLVTNAMAALLRRGVRSVRMAGSTGLNMAYVACGRLNAAFEHGDWERGLGPKIWDFSAGKLLVHEAGGVTRNLFAGGKGELDLMGRSQFSACSPELADEILSVVLKKP
eukprot:TRINITY_DN26882_c0_g1_i1.p1 TRINITY_DN26882_c0_g1~~TRINITY_DN26882_c0_g1_i1.p1  ORF type:complete len:305 (-),score=55.62 TRINITY_DN26882_c0_g1_i1:87-1001(-)